MRVELIAVKGPAEGRTFSFDEPDIFVFGRGLDAHCSVPSDRTISRNHFMIQISPPQCMVLDLNSSNGTIVNGVRYGGVNAPPIEGMQQVPPRTSAEDEHVDRPDQERVAAQEDQDRCACAGELLQGLRQTPLMR